MFTDISDHFAMSQIREIRWIQTIIQNFRVLNSQNTEYFRSLFHDTSQNNVYKQNDAESEFQTFMTTFNSEV